MRTLKKTMRAVQIVGAAFILSLSGSPAEAAGDIDYSSTYPLFTPPGPDDKFAYASSSITYGGSEYHFYCGNEGNGVISDHIRLRKYTYSGGVWNVTYNGTVMSPGSPGKWDDRHVCDPDVARGSFKLNGTNYKFVMAYTGTRDFYNNGTGNSVGLAFSNDLVNWTKRSSAYYDGGTGPGWGVGQPWITTVDSSTGEVLIGNTGGTYSHTVRHVKLNATTSAGGITVYKKWSPSQSGLSSTSNNKLAGADIAYDSTRDRFYTVHRKTCCPSNTPVATDLEVAWISGANFWGGTGSWSAVGDIDNSHSGHLMNHNAGIQTNEYGAITSSAVRILFATSNTNTWPGALWDYRIHAIHVDI